ncbi:hypothetical protein DFR50_104110, partial [Roseiarcus fermentans]
GAAATSTGTRSSSASSGTVTLTNGARLSVAGSVTAHGYIHVSTGSFTVTGGLTDEGHIDIGGTAQVASLSGQSIFLFVNSVGSFEVGTKGGAAKGSITVDAGASIAASAGLSLTATSIVNAGTITETGGALSLTAHSIVVDGTIAETGGTLSLQGTTSGSGTIRLGAKSILEIGTSSSNTPYAVSPSISGFEPSDGIVFDHLALTRAAYTSKGATTGTLNLYAGATLEETLLLTGQSYAGYTFLISPTIYGGSEITLSSDAFTWIGSTGGSWGLATNWQDTTTGQNPATTVPVLKNAVKIVGATGTAFEAIVGGGAAASVGLTQRVNLGGTYTFGALTVGAENLVPNGSAAFVSGNLALGSGSALTLGVLDLLDGQMTVGAGDRVTASGAVTIGQAAQAGVPTGGLATGSSAAVSGALTASSGSVFSASGDLSVVDGSLTVDGAGSAVSVGGNMQLGAAATSTGTRSSSASSGTVTLTNGARLSVAGSVTAHGYIHVSTGSFTVRGGLTDEGHIDIGGTAQVASLSGQSIFLFVNPVGSFEVGTKGGAAKGSITVDAGASIAASAGLSLTATSIVVNGTIAETGGTLSLQGATSGSGTIKLGAKSILEIGTSSSNQPYAVSPSISGFDASDTIVVDHLALTRAVYASTGATTGTLQLYAGATLEETLLLTGQSYASDTFFISPTANGGSEVTRNGDAFTWIGSTGGSWGLATNWKDTTTGQNPATTVPRANNAVTIVGATGAAVKSIVGGGAAASVGLTNQVSLVGTYRFGALTVGSETLVPNGAAKFTSGVLTLDSGSLNLGALDLLDGQMTVGAGASVTASGAVTIGQAAQAGVPTGGSTTGSSAAVSGDLDVYGGGAFTASGTLSVVNGDLRVSSDGTTVSVGGALQLGAPAMAATATNARSSSASSGGLLMSGGSLSVAGSVTAYGGTFDLLAGSRFTAKGGLIDDGEIDISGSAQVASLSCRSVVVEGAGSLEVGTEGGAAQASITVDAGASIASAAGLSLTASSIVNNGTITGTGGLVSLSAASINNAGTITQTGGTLGLSLTASSIVNAGTITGTGGALDLSAQAILDTGTITTSRASLHGISLQENSSRSYEPTITEAGGVLSLIADSIVVSGTIAETGGTLRLEGTTSGSGTIALGPKSILEIAPVFAVSTAISGFDPSDAILVDHLALTRAAYTSTGATTGTLQLYAGATLEETLLLTGQSYAADTFHIAPATNGGSQITLLAPNASHAST